MDIQTNKTRTVNLIKKKNIQNELKQGSKKDREKNTYALWRFE